MRVLAGIFLLVVACWATAGQAPVLRVGSKKFTESVVLGEITTALLRSSGIEARHLPELGGSRVLWRALLSGELDIYPEYSGTLRLELLAGDPRVKGDAELTQALDSYGVAMTRPLGFQNRYAIGVLESLARDRGLTKISDLRDHPQLRLGFSNEFMSRADGWPGLRRTYRLSNPATGLDHDLAYRGLASGALAAIDLYATDAEISYYGVRVLEDDLSYFPDYAALLLYRKDLRRDHPQAARLLSDLEGAIGQQEMIRLNALAKIEGRPSGEIAAAFLQEKFSRSIVPQDTGLWGRLRKTTLEQLVLVASSLGMAVLVAFPLGILAARRELAGRIILGVAGVIQTIPALALLVFMIPAFGIGAAPAIAALFLYSLLPMIRNTEAGLRGLPEDIIESARALGMSGAQRLMLVELPMARVTLLAGIKTAAVINIGTATLGALIGAGGYGQPILTGIRLDDISLIMEGALPAAVLAILVQAGFALAERKLAHGMP